MQDLKLTTHMNSVVSFKDLGNPKWYPLHGTFYFIFRIALDVTHMTKPHFFKQSGMSKTKLKK